MSEKKKTTRKAPAAPSPLQRQALERIAGGRFHPDLVCESDGWHARWRPDIPWLDEFVRTAAMTPLTEDAEDHRHATLHDAWMEALRSRTGLVRWDDGECRRFAEELKAWHGGDDESARAAVAFSFDPASGLSCALRPSRATLRALGQAAAVFGPLRTLRRAAPSAAGETVLTARLSNAEAEAFLRTGARDLAAAGYRVAGADLSAAVTFSAEIEESVRPNGRPATRLALTVRVAGEPVSAAEIRFLLEQESTLVFFRNRWIEVDRGILREALRALEKSGDVAANPVSFALGLAHVGRIALDDVRLGESLRRSVGELRAAKESDAAFPAVPGFEGTLRDYQRRGIAWLEAMTSRGYGALLADDMGLGKTIQTIGWILRGGFDGPVLVVAPLTLIANWQHEIRRFAPSLSTYVHHGDGRHVASGFHKAASEAKVVLTSYTLLVRDYDVFSEIPWAALVLDEAQAIKNPDTRAAKAACALRPPRRLALTGTPIENSAADLWSLEEFLNPGYLGARRDFAERFAKPLAADPLAPEGKRLRKAIEPLMLRRLKSDPNVAAEIGGKRTIREYCVLSAAQRADYETALADFRFAERRQGDALALLTRLKLVCDGDGKYERLYELLDQILSGGESALVFTQFASVGDEIRRRLDARFGSPVPFLHGGLSAAERERAIAAFEKGGLPGRGAASVFVLSLRAGGFGLNLVKATHVIHFDRWWNPAVENQATDRAHRIGQSNTVFVHDFITVGTLEEHIDEILAKKGTLEGVLRDGDLLERTVRLD